MSGCGLFPFWLQGGSGVCKGECASPAAQATSCNLAPTIRTAAGCGGIYTGNGGSVNHWGWLGRANCCTYMYVVVQKEKVKDICEIRRLDL